MSMSGDQMAAIAGRLGAIPANADADATERVPALDEHSPEAHTAGRPGDPVEGDLAPRAGEPGADADGGDPSDPGPSTSRGAARATGDDPTGTRR